ncbi:MAG TPA: ATP-binding protein [Methylomirabilota bacterium]|nr:ATP-binding protein [Methylomirabilota bacterium]
MPGDINCIVTKVLVPFVEREAGPPGVEAIVRAAGRSREYLVADHNWIPLGLADQLVRLAMALTGEADEERFGRRFWEYAMDWKPSREERSYLGTYSMGIGDPRTLYQRQELFQRQTQRWATFEVLEVGRTRARFRRTPLPGYPVHRWTCLIVVVTFERFPTNWGLPRAEVVERQCAARGDPACLIEVRWRNPSPGRAFWLPVAAGGAGAGALALALAGASVPWLDLAALAALPLVSGAALGYSLRERQRRRHTQRLLDLQGEEVIYSNNELEKKFRDLESKIDQLSLLIELSGVVNATLDPEKIYAQALDRLVHQMGYPKAHVLLVDERRRVLRGHQGAGSHPHDPPIEALALPLDAGRSGSAKAALTGLPVLVNDVERATEPVHRDTVVAHGMRSFVSVPLRVKERVLGVITVSAAEPDRFGAADLELVSAVANHVALAVDRAESFQTIEELTRGLEDKVRVRTEQLRLANEELRGAYRDLQATQMQLIQREKMASVGQLVAGVAHELNNPIGFVFSNVSTLEDFVRRLRAMLETYRAVPLPAADGARVQAQWEALKVDYALKYLDSMTQGIREGAERARKIVRDLRVFARSQDDVWQPVDIHEEIESSLTLLNHLLKDRVTVHRKFGELPQVECVRSQMDQVFLNLLANAAQAITGPGAITIETRQDAGAAVISIADTGLGISPAIMGRLFDPFFTTKPVGEGTGLGLSISYEIVKKHGGEIRAESPPGGGAVFTVSLPLARVGP